MRSLCSAEPEDPDKYIDPKLIIAFDLVRLPSKEVVTSLPRNFEGGAPDAIWSADSKFVALSATSGTRFSHTYVYQRAGANFIQLEADLRVYAKGDVRNQYVEPIRWPKPGALLLEQVDIFRGGEGTDATYRFIAKFDEKTGNFRIISKKKVSSKE